MRREFTATVADRELAVVAHAAQPGAWTVAVDGREATVEARQLPGGSWSLLVDGRSLLVDIERRAGALHIRAGEREFRVVLEDARRKALARTAHLGDEAGGSGEVITAPIAGKVVKFLVGAGDEVAPGAGVAVLEAMKMENEIKAERGGTVTDLHVEAGQSVETGEKLLTLGS